MSNMADHFDVDAFNMLREVMDDEFNALLQVFIEDSDQRLRALKTAQSGNDLRELAHGFKGASSNIGAMSLSDLCFQIERTPYDSGDDGLKSTLREIETEYHTVRSLLQSIIGPA